MPGREINPSAIKFLEFGEVKKNTITAYENGLSFRELIERSAR
jgi:hypothetical protein